MRPVQRILLGFVLSAASVSGATSSSVADITKAPRPDVASKIKVETVARKLANPWGMAFLPSGDMLVTERPGRLRVVSKDGKLSGPVAGLPEIAAVSQGGLLDVELGPDFATSGLIYLSFSSRYDGGMGTTVARGKLTQSGNKWQLDDAEIIFRQTPAVGTGRHFGSRLVFANDGKLYVTLGDRGRRDRSQDMDRHWAKVVRINPDGGVPDDNPFVGQSGVLPEIFSVGHRNAQGAALHPETGELWTVEHGAAGGDEINRVLAGKNYGWAVISYGRHYSGGKIGVGARKSGLEQPVYYWDPSIAPSGMIFYTGDLFPGWKGDILVGALRARMLVRLDVENGQIVREEQLLRNVGRRIRAVEQGPDGAIYVLTDHSDGAVLRLTLQ
ncbi:MAG: PQQ-dependent sugar dehydrogenase [Pseudomonadota bacterium]